MKIRSLFFLTIIAAILGMLIACGDTQASDKYTVSFEANGSYPAPQNQILSSGGKVTEPAYMTKVYYDFGGWYKEATFINLWNFTTDVVTGNITLYAKWNIRYGYIIVSFEANGGSPAPEDQIIGNYNSVTEPVAMTKTGYFFEGWYKEADCINQWNFYSDYVTANITLYAKWVLPRVVKDEIVGETLTEKFQWINSNAESHNTYILEVSKDEFLGPQDLSFSGKNNISIQLIGIGGEKTIERYGSGLLFTIMNNVTLILNENIVLKDGSVNVGGNLIMNNNSKINGSVSVSNGGTFTMNGGKIPRVSVSGGTFTMNGGEISGNTSGSGGVYISDGTFTMNGGEISGNTVSSSYSSYGGGGVYVSGTFTMTGGEISGNTTTSSSYFSGGGGGVYIDSNSRFEKTVEPLQVIPVIQ